MSCSQTPLSTHLLAIGLEPTFLERTAATFLARGVEAGDGLVVATTGGARERIAAALCREGVDVDGLLATGRLAVVHDDGRIGDTVRRVRSEAGVRRVRVYGDRTNRLWLAGDVDAAVGEQAAQHALLKQDDAVWLCPLQLDVCDPALDVRAAIALCRLHGRLYAVDGNQERRARLGAAIEQVLGVRDTGRLQLLLIASGLPAGQDGAEELAMLWLRAEVPHLARRILAQVHPAEPVRARSVTRAG